MKNLEKFHDTHCNTNKILFFTVNLTLINANIIQVVHKIMLYSDLSAEYLSEEAQTNK